MEYNLDGFVLGELPQGTRNNSPKYQLGLERLYNHLMPSSELIRLIDYLSTALATKGAQVGHVADDAKWREIQSVIETYAPEVARLCEYYGWPTVRYEVARLLAN